MADLAPPLTSIWTSRLLLRPVVLADLSVLSAMQTDPVVMEHYGDGRPLTPEQADEPVTRYHVRCREHDYWAWAVTDADTREVLGQVTAGWDALDGRPAVALGYLLKRSAWGHGYGPEAIAAVVRHGLDDLGWPRVWASVSLSNGRSLRLCEKAGLTFFREQPNGRGRPSRVYTAEPAT